MADPAKVGKPWGEDELDAIVGDYFAMLLAELAHLSYVKSKHSAALMARIGRTHRSVEFKHQNISAVLDELGLPWIAGYIPKRNYQNAIFPAVERYLRANPSILSFVPAETQAQRGDSSIFVNPPEVVASEAPLGLKRLVRKFDPVQRDHRNRLLGRAGEAFVVGLETNGLVKQNRKDLARQVRWIAEEEGDGAGYDILSFTSDGAEKLIEVKTTNGSARTPFFLSRNEYATAAECSARWCIYRVHQFATDARIFVMRPPLEKHVNLVTETWRASFRFSSEDASK